VRIGFVGQMRSGKDTCAEYLVQKHGGTILKFADPMYAIHDFAVNLLGLEGKQRRLLQLIGTEWGRETLGESFWIDQFQRTLEQTPGNVFVTDCRFPNEAERLKALGFTLIGVTRPEDQRIAAGASSQNHASEIHIPDIPVDGVVKNGQSLAHLYASLDALLAEAPCEPT